MQTAWLRNSWSTKTSLKIQSEWAFLESWKLILASLKTYCWSCISQGLESRKRIWPEQVQNGRGCTGQGQVSSDSWGAGASGSRQCGAICPEPGGQQRLPLRICNPSLLPPQLIVLVFSSHRSLHVLSFISTRFRCDFKIICEDFKGSQQRRKSKWGNWMKRAKGIIFRALATSSC